MKNRYTVHIKDSIATYLLKVVFSLYFFIALVVTIIHMVAEYKDAKKNITKDMNMFRKTFESSIADATWNVNLEQLNSIVEGMINLPSIVGVRIEDMDGFVLGQAGYMIDDQNNIKLVTPGESEKIVPKKSFNFFDQLFSYEFPLNIMKRNEKFPVGKVTFYSSTRIVFEKVKMGFIFILGNAIIKTLALWIIFLVCSRSILSRPLSLLTSATQKLDLDHLENTKVTIQTKGNNELKILETVFNRAIEKIKVQHRIVTQQNEKLKQLDKMKDELIANVSHEFRTPLAGILGFAELLIMDALEDEEEKLDCYNSIYKDTKRLLRVLNNVINLSMLESESKTIVNGPVVLSKLKKKLQLKWRKTIKDGFIVDFPEDIEFNSDGKMLEIVFDELIHNGMVFNKNEPEIKICSYTENEHILFRISDNGIGIQEESLPYIFNKFYRVDSGINYKVTGGIGLGLTVAKLALEILGGTISFERNKDEGSTFIIKLPKVAIK